MLKAMIEHYSPLLTSVKTMFGFKSSSVIGASVFSAISFEALIQFVFKGEFMGASILLLLIISGLILTDWWYGTKASKKLASKALLDKNKEEFEKNKFRSIKISHTYFKFLSVWLWLVVALSVQNYANSITWLQPIIEGFLVVPLLLFGFREFVSIGESIEILIGYRPYLFELGEKIFDTLQLKFLKRLQ